MGLVIDRLRSWLDSTPVAAIALALMRDATGRAEPLEPVRPVKRVALPGGFRIGFWSLTGGVGVSTTAALLAHRSAGAGGATVLVDLDRWAPSLALRARIDGATIGDALLRPGRERECLSRWSEVSFLPGAPGLHAIYATDRIIGSLDRIADGASLVLDLGSGPDALNAELLQRLDRLCVVAGVRAGQLQSAFCSVDLLRDAPCEVGLVVANAETADAERVAARLPWPLLATIPADRYLADDTFAARAPTMLAVDRLIRACA